MKETKIIVNIDSDGKISAETKGITGETCVAELENLLKDICNIETIEKTDDYYKKAVQQEIKYTSVKRW